MARWIVPSGDREADLVVELGRRRDIAFLLNVESHAGVGQMICWPPYGASAAGTIPLLAYALVPVLALPGDHNRFSPHRILAVWP